MQIEDTQANHKIHSLTTDMSLQTNCKSSSSSISNLIRTQQSSEQFETLQKSSSSYSIFVTCLQDSGTSSHPFTLIKMLELCKEHGNMPKKGEKNGRAEREARGQSMRAGQATQRGRPCGFHPCLRQALPPLLIADAADT